MRRLGTLSLALVLAIVLVPRLVAADTYSAAFSILEIEPTTIALSAAQRTIPHAMDITVRGPFPTLPAGKLITAFLGFTVCFQADGAFGDACRVPSATVTCGSLLTCSEAVRTPHVMEILVPMTIVTGNGRLLVQPFYRSGGLSWHGDAAAIPVSIPNTDIVRTKNPVGGGLANLQLATQHMVTICATTVVMTKPVGGTRYPSTNADLPKDTALYVTSASTTAPSGVTWMQIASPSAELFGRAPAWVPANCLAPL